MYVEEIGDLEGGDYEEDEERTQECAAHLRLLHSTGSLFNDNDSNADKDSGIKEFSWSSCDCCMSNLGGSRHRYAFWPRDE
jgi:hypothetical protein